MAEPTEEAAEPTSEVEEVAEPQEPTAFPPYPPYVVEPAPPSVADTIMAGRDLRVQHKSLPKKPVHPPPKPARPRGPKATDVKLAKRAMRAHARCLKRHGTVLTDRLERIAKPRRRAIIYLWREQAQTLPPETIARLRSMLDADEPFKPDQAYEYFINLRKSKKKTAAVSRVNEIKKDILSLYGDKRFTWARNATVAFARGIQCRLSRPGRYALADGMLRLSNIVLDEICGYMHMKTPSRRSSHPKAKFMMEMADKVAVWIDEILSESDDRMLMMDFDEDEDILSKPGGDASFADDFLDMMGDSGGAASKFLAPNPAYMKFSGPMLEAFLILMDSMKKKGDETLLTHGKFSLTFNEGVDELKTTPDFSAPEYNSTLANTLNSTLTSASKSDTPSNLTRHMADVVDICSKYLAQYAEYNKDKGPAFKLLVEKMRAKGNDKLFQKDKINKTYGAAATDLEKAKGLETDHDEPNLSQAIHADMTKLMEGVTPENLKKDMEETTDICSKYLSQAAIDQLERGPAFDILIKELEQYGDEHFSDFPPLPNKFAAAYTLKSAPGLTGVTPDPPTVPIFSELLHKVGDPAAPKRLKQDMDDVIKRCADYLSAFVRDRDAATKKLLEMMKSKPTNVLAARAGYSMNYGTGATETENAPIIVPYLPIKDISDEGKQALTKDMEDKTPPDLRIAVKAVIQDVARYLSQPIALRSGVAGPRYPLEFLSAIKKALGSRPLFKYKAYGQSYADAASTLIHAGPLDSTQREATMELRSQIKSEMKRGVPSQLAPTIATELNPTMESAATHLANVGTDKGDTLTTLVGMMKEKGEIPLAQLQGYDQTYGDGGRRIETATSLANDKVEKAGYEKVKGKLTTLAQGKAEVIPETQAKYMPEMIDESSKFLAAPVPETNAEKRKVLADLMGRGGSDVLGQEGAYKMTFKEGGEEIRHAPVGVTTSHDEAKKKVMVDKVNTVIADKKMQTLLKDPVQEGTAYLTDTIKGRGEAMEAIQKSMQKEKAADFLTVGKFSKTHEGAAAMLQEAQHFADQHPAPVLLGAVEQKVINLPAETPSDIAKRHMDDAKDITSKYIAGVATKECGLSAKALADMEASGLGVGAGGAGSASGAAGAGGAGGAEGAGSAGGAGGPAGETDEERRARLAREAEEKERLKKLAEEERLKRLAEMDQRKKMGGASTEDMVGRRPSRIGQAFEGADDLQHRNALHILRQQLDKHGGEVFYEQPHMKLSHKQASDWLGSEPLDVAKSVKESGDTARLHKKFEKKLSALVSTVTPANMYDTMQDVTIESARQLSERFVSTSYKAQAREALISEMQKRGNEILTEVNGNSETTFFAAQRLKKVKDPKTDKPCTREAPRLSKKLEDVMRYHSNTPRKLGPTIKDHTKDAANYLSTVVTKPDDHIEAYVALLEEMEAAGDTPLIEGDIPKSHEEAAAYLRQLTSFDDKINHPNSAMHGHIKTKLHSLMSRIPEPPGYTKAVMDGKKTQALHEMVRHMDEAGNNVLLRHGNVRKSYRDGADILRGKHTDQLRNVPNADPVVARKIQIKLHNLMKDNTPEKFRSVMGDVIEDATMYLGIHLLELQVIKVCKCMKNVFVQCELWCEEILRRVGKPPCTCSRHISVQDLQDLAPTHHLRICPGTSRTFAPGLEVAVTECHSKHLNMTGTARLECQAPMPSAACRENATTSYLLHSTAYSRNYALNSDQPTRIPAQNSTDPDSLVASTSRSPPLSKNDVDRASTVKSLLMDIHSQNVQFFQKQEKNQCLESVEVNPQGVTLPPTTLGVYRTGTSPQERPVTSFQHSPMTTFANIHFPDRDRRSPLGSPQQSNTLTQIGHKTSYCSRTPISTDQMADWHAMLVSLMWNVQAWRKWIQENIDRGLADQYDPNISTGQTEDWISFQKRLSTEALQWRQYNIFSRQLTLRLIKRYNDKEIVSPTRATVKTEKYRECSREMLEIIEMFNKWTQWLNLVIKETGSLRHTSGSNVSLGTERWNHYKKKIGECSKDWVKYNLHLKVYWEQKYASFISECVPHMTEPGPVWVVSACGAVPSGAVAAGIYDGEVIWVARTTHKCHVLPAALQPSKHCCLVYANGAVHYYTKYQVMCNGDVSWLAWRGGAVGARAVRVAEGTFIGRVHYRGSHLLGPVYAPQYRCHVVIYGRPFAFNCYELLVLAEPKL